MMLDFRRAKNWVACKGPHQPEGPPKVIDIRHPEAKYRQCVRCGMWIEAERFG